MKVISKDHSMDITQDEDIQNKFNKLMADFLRELPPRIEHIPTIIHLSVEKGNDGWNFVANIESAQHSVQADGAEVFHSLNEVKEKYFPNRSLDELEGRVQKKVIVIRPRR